MLVGDNLRGHRPFAEELGDGQDVRGRKAQDGGQGIEDVANRDLRDHSK